QPTDNAQERGLAAARWPQQHHKLTVRYRQGDAVNSGNFAESLDDIPGQYRSHWTSRKFQNPYAPPAGPGEASLVPSLDARSNGAAPAPRLIVLVCATWKWPGPRRGMRVRAPAIRTSAATFPRWPRIAAKPT